MRGIGRERVGLAGRKVGAADAPHRVEIGIGCWSNLDVFHCVARVVVGIKNTSF
jgi:hypothetical protein